VLTTLHTRDAKGAVTRLIDLFPTHNHSETCSMLSISLRAVVSQHLLPSVYPGEKRELALEVMFNTNPVSAAIRMGRMDSLDNAILTGRKEGMITLDESVKRLYKAERISQATAERFVSDKDLLRR
jgi:twitching motility protein PilT